MEDKKRYREGLIAAIGTGCLWGVLPIYWKSIESVDSWVIILYRICLVGVCCFLFALKQYGFEGIKAPLRVKGVVLRYFIAGIVVTINWSTYIWAVNAGHVIECSIGYYIEPLIISLFGVIIFKEKMNGMKKLAFGLAVVAVLIMVVHFGQIPVIAFTLAISFATYAAIKKSYQMPPTLSLLYETMFLVPVTFIAIVYLEMNGQGALTMVNAPYEYVLLLLCGVLTALPLGFFAFATSRLDLITLGLMQYISPTISLILGIFLFREPFDIVQFGAVAIIWVGLVFFTLGDIREARK
ncbi:MAG: EamA family transporter RarD [Firmicutes bacterium]|nr:EamA family transporter RarD [Bacillota bacterium]MBQ9973167.1 EamA family transporter RarD [Bacillota bacterium]